MVEVNEEIVRQYLELKGFFVKTDVQYLLAKQETGKKSSGYGDVDILCVHPNGTRYLVEVKAWHMEAFTPSYFERGEPYVGPLAKKKATEVFNSGDFKTILVVPKVGSRSKAEVGDLASKEGIDEIWEFKDILKELIAGVSQKMSYDSEVLQVIRLLKRYDFLK